MYSNYSLIEFNQQMRMLELCICQIDRHSLVFLSPLITSVLGYISVYQLFRNCQCLNDL